ncbi:MAG: hypothetical protein AB7F43_00970 [Bacteriovoracia bacterium]
MMDFKLVASVILISIFLNASPVSAEPLATDLDPAEKTCMLASMEKYILPLSVNENNASYGVRAQFMGRDFYAHGVLNEGTLHFNFHLKDGEFRHPLLKGKEQFEKLMKKFGNRVQRVEGHWVDGDNLAAVNTLTRGPKRLPLEVAALKTWTGKRAVEYGFTKVKIITVKGRPGRFREVKVVFEK